MKKLTVLLLILVGIMAVWLGYPPPSNSTPLNWWHKSQRLWQLQQQSMPRHLPIPVEGIRPSQLQDTWGAARSGGRRHEGIDIFAKKGTPIRSSTTGIVLMVGWDTLGGQVVWVLGQDLSRHYYAHLSAYGAYSTGSWVNQGDIIGYVGNTGNARTTPPHLHYGIYLSQGAVNPYPYLVN
jgi:peptidoglycan LD-endopeptidase LytH